MIFHLIDNLSMNRREEKKIKKQCTQNKEKQPSENMITWWHRKIKKHQIRERKITRQTVKCERVIKNPNFSK